MVAASGSRDGLQGSLRFIAGLDSAYLVLAIVVGLGLSDVLQAFPEFADYLKLFGSFYILFLAYRFIRAAGIEYVSQTASFGFWDGVLVQIANAKGIVMLVVMFSEFSMAESTQQVVLLSLALIGLNLLSHLLWATAGGAIKQILQRHRQFLPLQNLAFAAMRASVAIWMILR